jgi:hypothetical protein
LKSYKNIIRMIETWIRCEGHAACMVGNPEGRRPLDWSIILKRIFNEYNGKVWTWFIWLRIGTSVWLL